MACCVNVPSNCCERQACQVSSVAVRVASYSVFIRSNSASSASLKSSVADCRSLLQKPSRLQRFRNESRRARSAAEHIPDHAGEQYVILEMTVARNTSCNESGGMP